jgi:uroporphyrinogen decarboxylase
VAWMIAETVEHGISQFTPPEHVAELVDEVHRHSRTIRAAGAGGTTSTS